MILEEPCVRQHLTTAGGAIAKKSGTFDSHVWFTGWANPKSIAGNPPSVYL
jgi:hypothetical protein